ncbi:MAG: hypothetical protein M0D55_03600 [Elusimicrobiota bacterium]|nr:MAG: hypothetical protein M0D55_03600 [Elusimicrobiota bacterium]
MKLLTKVQSSIRKAAESEDGVVGYGLAWLLGVPVSVLVVIYLIFGR